MVLRKVSYFAEFARTLQQYIINLFLLRAKNFFRYREKACMMWDKQKCTNTFNGLTGNSLVVAFPVAVLLERPIYSSIDSLLKECTVALRMGQDMSHVNIMGIVLDLWPYFFFSSVMNCCRHFLIGCSSWESASISIFTNGSLFFISLHRRKL